MTEKTIRCLNGAGLETSLTVVGENMQGLMYLANCVRRGGPEPNEYAEIGKCFRSLAADNVDAQTVAEVFSSTLTVECIHGHGYLKPRGYSGDFEMLDRIYTKWVSADPRLAKWDLFFHDQPAPKAVRNRKTFFQDLLCDLDRRVASRAAEVLNIGSGPGRDIMEYFSSHTNSRLRVTSLDVDRDAISHSEGLCRPYLDRAKFECQNVFKYTPQGEFDLVWSAGLFDYFSDRMFTRLARRLLASVRQGGELVVGNFGPENTSREYMELLGRWHLEHRSSERLLALAAEAGAAPGTTKVEREPEGINLFLRISVG